MKWIDANKELPDTDRNVLVSDGKRVTGSFNDCDGWNPMAVESSYDMAHAILDMDVTHWSEIPELPKH